MITLAICSKCSKICLIPFAELSILDVVFALRIPCSCVLWEKVLENIIVPSHLETSYIRDWLPRFSSPGLEDLVQGESGEERNDGGDSGPDKPGTSEKVFCCASSMFSLSLFSDLTTVRQIPHLVRSSDLAPRKMEKDDAPMCSLPFNIFKI